GPGAEGTGRGRQRRGGRGGAGGQGRGRGRGPGSGARPASARPGARDRARGQDNVEQPRTDEQAVSAEGREQPVIEPQVEVTPQEVAEAPDTTTPTQQVEDPTKLEQSGDPSEAGSGAGEPAAARRKDRGKSRKAGRGRTRRT